MTSAHPTEHAPDAGRRGPSAVLFDAAGTLFAVHPPFCELIVAHAVRSGAPCTLGAVERAVAHVGGTAGWPDDQPDPASRRAAWAEFVTSILAEAGIGREEAGRRRTGRSVAEVIVEPRNYRVFPDVPEVLAGLAASGTAVGIVSNFDDLLFDILRCTRLDAAFPVVVTSYRSGVSKPDPRIFHQALSAMKADPGSACYVGDSVYSDMGGARAAGLRGILIDRDGTHHDYTGTRITSLLGLPALLNPESRADSQR
ncbi:HAD family hydrolase [Streptomyces albofaciens JCM 4342]|uniref:HAD family hydrolase n=1 Tax=Streptomyces albofaciens TaxID=66866 RepID=UPI00123C7230|nr:HAD-IA family hydrolase [Streptomyces albofaciens]KAA6223789.1 HAD family hydrolase [Streptomyces albofaciens JCM 4342]